MEFIRARLELISQVESAMQISRYSNKTKKYHLRLAEKYLILCKQARKEKNYLKAIY